MKRFALLAAGLLFLSACGFTPIYGPKGGETLPVAKALNDIFISNIPNEDGQKLRNKLIDRLYTKGRPLSPVAKLTVSIQTGEVDLGIQKDSTATVVEMTMTAPYLLRDRNGKDLLRGTARSVVLYSRLDAQYGILAAKRNAVDRAIAEITEQVVGRLALFYAETPPERTAEDDSTVSPETGWALGLE